MNEGSRIEGLLTEISAVVWCVEKLVRLRVAEGSSGVLRLYVSKKLRKDRIKVERVDTSATPFSFDICITFRFF